MSRNPEAGGFAPPGGTKSENEAPQRQPKRLPYAYPESGAGSVTNPDAKTVSRRSFLGRALRGGLGAASLYHVLRQKSDSSEASLLHAYMEHKDQNYKLAERRVLQRVERATSYFTRMSDEEGITTQLHGEQLTAENRMRAFGDFLDYRAGVLAARDGVYAAQKNITPDDDYKRLLFRVDRDMERYDLYFKRNPVDDPWTVEHAVVEATHEVFKDMEAMQELKAAYGVSVEVGADTWMNGLRYVLAFYKLFPPEAVKKHFPKRIIFASLPIGGGTAIPFADAIIMQYGSFETTAHEITHFLNNKGSVNEFALSSLGLVPRTKTNEAFRQLNTEDVPYAHDSGAAAIVDRNIFGDYAEPRTPDKGYVSSYAYEGGEEEDIAEVSTRLFGSYGLTSLLLDSLTDEVQKQKVEYIAGYKLDGPPVWAARKVRGDGKMSPQLWDYFSKYGRAGNEQFKLSSFDFSLVQHTATHPHKEFYEYANSVEFVQVPTFGTPIPEADYRQKGFAGVEFWRKWLGSGVSAELFNAILRGEKDLPEDPLKQFEKPKKDG